MLRRYASAAQAVLRASALPYGYTATLWSTGAVMMAKHGSPHVAFTFLFAGGAIGGFAAMAVLGRAGAPEPLEARAGELLLTGATHVAAVGGAVGAAALIAEIHAGVAWPLASFAATAVYLAVASLELLLAQARPRA